MNSNDSQSLIEDLDYVLPGRVTIWWFIHDQTSGKGLLIDKMYTNTSKTYAEGMTEENLKLKCVTGGKLLHCDEVNIPIELGAEVIPCRTSIAP